MPSIRRLADMVPSAEPKNWAQSGIEDELEKGRARQRNPGGV
jgi:hypothetical protein